MKQIYKQVLIGSLMLLIAISSISIFAIQNRMHELFNTSIGNSLLLNRVLKDFDIVSKNIKVISETEKMPYIKYEITETPDSAYTLFMNYENEFLCILEGDKVLLGMKPYID